MKNRTLHVFPTASAVDTFNRAEADRRGGTLLGVSAIPIKRFMEQLAKASIAGRLLGDAGRRLLLKETVEAHYAGGGYYAELSQFPGFIEALGDLIAALKQALLTSESFASLIARFPHERRLDELVQLYAAYEAALDSKSLADSGDVAIEALAAVMRDGLKLEALKGVELIEYHHIYEFPPVQRELATALAKLLPVKINFPYDHDRPELFTFVTKTVEEFERHFDDSDSSLEVDFPEPEKNFLYPLLDRLFKPASGEDRLEQPEELTCFSAGGTYAECEEVGRRVRELIDSGARPSDIAVLCRQLHTHGEMLADVFHRFQVPISYQRGTPLAAASLVQAVTSPYRILRDHYARHELLGFIGSSYLMQHTCRNGVSADTFEKVLNLSGYIDATVAPVIGAVDCYLEKRRVASRITAQEEECLTLLREIIADLECFALPMTVREHCQKLEWFMGKYGVLTNVATSKDDRVLRRDMSAVALFRKVLLTAQADVASLGVAEKKVTATEFLSLLRFGMKGEFLAGEYGEGVAVYTFQDVRGMKFDHVFIAGLNDGICPKRQFGHPLFKDEEKLAFNKSYGQRPFRTAAEYSLEEPLLFYLALGCARATLTLSYSYIDSKGDATLRSPYLDDLFAVLAVKEDRLQLTGAAPAIARCYDAEEIVNIVSATNLALVDAAGFAAATSPAPDLMGRLIEVRRKASIEQLRAEYFSAHETKRPELANAYVGHIAAPDLRELLRKRLEVSQHNSYSATELELYAGCKFRYFMSRLLKADEIEAPKLMVDSRTEGELAHKILELFYKELHAAKKLPLKGTTQEITTLLRVASEVFNTAKRDLSPVQRVLWNASQHKMELSLTGYLHEQAGCSGSTRAVAFEHPFLNFQACDHEGVPYYLNGKIDRIDLDRVQELINVVDYKHASNQDRYRKQCQEESFGITSFQLPIYLAVALDYAVKMYKVEAKNASAQYALLKKGVSCGFGSPLDQEQLRFFSAAPADVTQAPEENLFGRIGKVISNIKEGDFCIGGNSCDYCPAASVCRRPRVAA